MEVSKVSQDFRRCLNTALNKKNQPEITRDTKPDRYPGRNEQPGLNIVFDLTEILIDELYCEYRQYFRCSLI